jgi:hypothetical protein
MVALSIMALHMTRAPTQVTCSLLKIVQSKDGISHISPAKNPCSVPFRLSPHSKTLFQNLTPVLERAAHYIRCRVLASTFFHRFSPLPDQSNVERTRIIGRGILVSTVVTQLTEISLSKPSDVPPKALLPGDHNHPERPCWQGFWQLFRR